MPRANAGQRRIGCQPSRQRVQGTRRQGRVRVEQQHIGTGQERVGQRDVDPGTEPQVAPRVEVAHSGSTAYLLHVGRGGVVDDGHRPVGNRAQGPREQLRRTVGNDDDLDRPRTSSARGARGARGERGVGGDGIQALVTVRDRRPGAPRGPRQPGLATLAPLLLVGRHRDERRPERGGVAGRDESAHSAHHVREGAAVAGDHWYAARHRLDRDPPELLDPPRRRQRGHRQDIQSAIEVGQL